MAQESGRLFLFGHSHNHNTIALMALVLAVREVWDPLYCTVSFIKSKSNLLIKSHE